MRDDRSRFTNEFIWFLVCVACDHTGAAKQSLWDLKELGEDMKLGSDWADAVDDILADLHRTEMHRKAGSILRLHSLAQDVIGSAPGD